MSTNRRSEMEQRRGGRSGRGGGPETPWLTAGEEAAWRALLRMNDQLAAELNRRMTSESSLSLQDYGVLVHLTDHPESRLRLFELGDRLGWEKSRVSHHVARMAERGLVAKVRCPTDRRGWFVAITPEGRAAIASAAPGHVEAVRELFVDRLTPQQLRTLIDIGDAVLPPLDEAAEGGAAPDAGSSA